MKNDPEPPHLLLAFLQKIANGPGHLNTAFEGLFIDFLSRLSRRPLRKRREEVFLCALFDLSTHFERFYQYFRCAWVIFWEITLSNRPRMGAAHRYLQKMISFHQW